MCLILIFQRTYASSVACHKRALYQNLSGGPSIRLKHWTRLLITLYKYLLTLVGAPVARGPRIIDTADAAVATPLESSLSRVFRNPYGFFVALHVDLIA